jgi:hypothetical protein
MHDAFSGYGPHEESLYGKVPIWVAITTMETFATMMSLAFPPDNLFRLNASWPR